MGLYTGCQDKPKWIFISVGRGMATWLGGPVHLAKVGHRLIPQPQFSYSHEVSAMVHVVH